MPRAYTLRQLIEAAEPPEPPERYRTDEELLRTARAGRPAQAARPRARNPPPGPEGLTAEQAAERLGVGLRTLYRLVEQGRLAAPVRYAHKLVRYRAEDLDAYLRRNP